MSCPEDGAGKVQWDTVRDGVQIINRFINTIFMIMKTKLLLAGLAFFAFATMASAQDTNVRGNRQYQNQNQSPGFRDADKDGVCDNYAARRSGQGNATGYGRGNGRNQCLNQANGRGGSHQGRRNFVDVNKNGICDRLETPVVK